MPKDPYFDVKNTSSDDNLRGGICCVVGCNGSTNTFHYFKPGAKSETLPLNPLPDNAEQYIEREVSVTKNRVGLCCVFSCGGITSRKLKKFTRTAELADDSAMHQRPRVGW